MTIQQYLDLFPKTTLTSDYQFWVLIENAIDILGVYRRELAHEFGVGIGTVKRWINRESAPHPAMRQIVFDYLKKRAEEKLAGEAQK